MSEFDGIHEAVSRPAMLAIHGRTVRYFQPPDDVGSEITAIVGGIREERDQDERGQAMRRTRPLTVSLDDVADPTHYDRVKIDGEMWEVETVDRPGGGVAELTLAQRPVVERSRDRFRMAR